MSALVFESPPVTPTAQQATVPRSFISLNPEVRGQHPPFPLTPAIPSSTPPLDPPHGMLFADYLRTWSDAQTARWLAECKCAHHADAFRINDIRGDILLELDQLTLKELGITSIGDRLRMLNAVKHLRQRASPRPTLPPVAPNAAPAPRPSKRPAPLHLNGTTHPQTDLPAIVREQPPDSARTNLSTTPFRPLPQPGHHHQQTPNVPTTPGYPRTQLPPLPPPPRGQPPPVPTLPRPSNRSNWATTPTTDAPPPSYATATLSPAHQPLPSQLLTPSTYHSPPNNLPNKIPPRSTSPLSTRPPGRPSPILPGHGRNGSGSLISPSTTGNPLNKLPPRPSTTGTNLHPYANPQAATALQPPTGYPIHTLSPIEERSFDTTLNNSSSSPASQCPIPRPPFHSNLSSTWAGQQLSLDEIRRKLVKFVLPDEGNTYTIDVASCYTGIEVLQKVLKKFGKGGSKTIDGDPLLEHALTLQGGLTVDGWGVYLDFGQQDGPGEPLTEAELMSICHAPPDHPTREHGLYLRRTKVPRRNDSPSRLVPTTTNKTTKRASSVSILSSLGVRDPERALDPPSSPTSATISGGRLSPAAKRPSKLRNFFGQRPPSELINNHLPEYFPNTEKKILERTARHSMMMKAKTEPFPSRFSVSSGTPSVMSILPPPPVPDKYDYLSAGAGEKNVEELPRMSLSTDDGRSIDLHPDSEDTPSSSSSTSYQASSRTRTPYSSPSTSTTTTVTATTTPSSTRPLLPPIPFPSESLSESFEDVITSSSSKRRISRSPSISSSRMSYMTELRSKKDRSDTASLMTVDQITAEVESRRASSTIDGHGGSGEGNDDSGEEGTETLSNTTEGDWTKVGVERAPDAPVDEKDVVVKEYDEDDLEGEDDLEDEDEDEDEDDDVDDGQGVTLNGEDDDIPKSIETKFKSNKWIKGALIGAGSFGKVYLGMDASNGLLMAVKQVELPTGSLPNQERKKSMLNALEREIELLKNLQHENIVQYLYSSVDDEYLNIFLEYVPGGSVATLLRNYGAFEEPLVKNFVRQILFGLSYLHERDIIHRDIKGANILVDNKGGVKISDFGISKKVNDNLLASKMHRFSLQGSVFWMAPEVVKQSGHTRKADIWSVGCLVVEMLTGEHPWAQLTQMQAIFKIGSSARPAMPSDITPEAADFLAKTFELDQNARPSATELSQHLFVCVRKK